jgi:hypothetical protein
MTMSTSIPETSGTEEPEVPTVPTTDPVIEDPDNWHSQGGEVKPLNWHSQSPGETKTP